jgi:type II secretory ATPase GspE/PulE/Tfp pilus assembly ATPase PilB-like protein
VASGVIRDRIYRGQRASDLLPDARTEGMTTLAQDGVRKVIEGLTDLGALTAVAMR